MRLLEGFAYRPISADSRRSEQKEKGNADMKIKTGVRAGGITAGGTDGITAGGNP